VCNGIVVIQVDATLVWFTNIAQQLKEIPKIPLDNIREEIVGIPQHQQPAMPTKDPAVADKAAIPQLLTHQNRQLPAPKPRDVIRIN